LLDRQRTAPQEDRKALSFDVLHHDEGTPLVLEHVVHRRHMRVRNAGGSARLADHAFAEVGPRGGRGEQALECDLAIEPRILRQEHFPHATATEPVQHHVRTNPAPRGDVDRIQRDRQGCIGGKREDGGQALEQRRIVALLPEKPLTIRRGSFQGGEDQFLRLFPRCVAHRSACTPPCTRTAQGA
jgi:hypothetical protein